MGGLKRRLEWKVQVGRGRKMKEEKQGESQLKVRVIPLVWKPSTVEAF